MAVPLWPIFLAMAALMFGEILFRLTATLAVLIVPIIVPAMLLYVLVKAIF
jgi:hypothetical protein